MMVYLLGSPSYILCSFVAIYNAFTQTHTTLLFTDLSDLSAIDPVVARDSCGGGKAYQRKSAFSPWRDVSG